jgi:cytochrome c oxidase assembly factor CtaG
MLLTPILGPAAHRGTPLSESWTQIEPPVALGIGLLTALYLYAVGPLRERYGWAARVEARSVVCFMLAMIVAFVALQGPLHILSDEYLLTAHMTQHLLVTLIMPPLLLKGLPAWLIDRVLLLPLYARRFLRRRRLGSLAAAVPRGPALLRIGHIITSPLVSFAAFNVVFVLWHVPAFYDATLTNERLHSLMHSMFIGTAILTRWPIFSPSNQVPALSYPLQMFYLFFQSIPSTILGAIITFASVILYPTYTAAPRLGLSPQADQQLAGLLMVWRRWIRPAAADAALVSMDWT